MSIILYKNIVVYYNNIIAQCKNKNVAFSPKTWMIYDLGQC